MKMMMLTGAALGFGVGVAFSLLRQSPWPTVVWQACVAAYVAGLMFRWWAGHWMRNLRLSLSEKHAAALREAALPVPVEAMTATARGAGTTAVNSIVSKKR